MSTSEDLRPRDNRDVRARRATLRRRIAQHNDCHLNYQLLHLIPLLLRVSSDFQINILLSLLGVWEIWSLGDFRDILQIS